MKRKINLLSLLFFLCLIFVSCKKKPFDFRNKIIGDWEFRVNRSELNTDSLGYHHQDLLTYQGNIKYGSEKDEITIEYTPENSITLKMDKEKQLSGFPTHYSGGHFIGTDSLYLYLRWGGLGGGITHIVEGKKQ